MWQVKDKLSCLAFPLWNPLIGESKYLCNTCGTTFHRASALSKHLKKHQPKPAGRAFACVQWVTRHLCLMTHKLSCSLRSFTDGQLLVPAAVIKDSMKQKISSSTWTSTWVWSHSSARCAGSATAGRRTGTPTWSRTVSQSRLSKSCSFVWGKCNLWQGLNVFSQCSCCSDLTSWCSCQ